MREIGWSTWDPIGLRNIEPNWQIDCPDEYDRYLQEAASMLWRGRSAVETARYLEQCVTEAMGLSHVDAAACAATAAALNGYLDELRRPDMKRSGPKDRSF